MSFLSVPSISIISSNSIHSRYIFFLSVYKPLFYPLFYLNCYDWAQTEALAAMSEQICRVCELAHSIACGWNGTLGLGSDDNLRRFTARTRPGLPGPHPDQMPCPSRSRQRSLGEGEGVSKFETSHCNPVGNQSHSVRASHPPEASLASSSVMAARSVDSECKSRVIEPRKNDRCGSLRSQNSGGNIGALYGLGVSDPAGV